MALAGGRLRVEGLSVGRPGIGGMCVGGLGVEMGWVRKPKRCLSRKRALHAAKSAGMRALRFKEFCLMRVAEDHLWEPKNTLRLWWDKRNEKLGFEERILLGMGA